MRKKTRTQLHIQNYCVSRKFYFASDSTYKNNVLKVFMKLVWCRVKKDLNSHIRLNDAFIALMASLQNIRKRRRTIDICHSLDLLLCELLVRFQNTSNTILLRSPRRSCASTTFGVRMKGLPWGFYYTITATIVMSVVQKPRALRNRYGCSIYKLQGRS